MDLFIIPHVLYLPASPPNHYFQHIGLIQLCGIEFYLRLSWTMQKTTLSHFLSSGAPSGNRRHDEQEGRAGGTKRVCVEILLLWCTQTHRCADTLAERSQMITNIFVLTRGSKPLERVVLSYLSVGKGPKYHRTVTDTQRAGRCS